MKIKWLLRGLGLYVLVILVVFILYSMRGSNPALDRLLSRMQPADVLMWFDGRMVLPDGVPAGPFSTTEDQSPYFSGNIVTSVDEAELVIIFVDETTSPEHLAMAARAGIGRERLDNFLSEGKPLTSVRKTSTALILHPWPLSVQNQTIMYVNMAALTEQRGAGCEWDVIHNTAFPSGEPSVSDTCETASL